ncbi:hypothetical protein D3C78_1092690 [compost metagenome]
MPHQYRFDQIAILQLEQKLSCAVYRLLLHMLGQRRYVKMLSQQLKTVLVDAFHILIAGCPLAIQPIPHLSGARFLMSAFLQPCN